MVFDLGKPAVKAIKSSMGGGWVVPLTVEGACILTEYFGEGPTELPPIRQQGWIVEPADAGDLAEYLHNEKLAWVVE